MINDKSSFVAWLETACPHFLVLQRLTNGTKHCAPVHSTKKIAGMEWARTEAADAKRVPAIRRRRRPLRSAIDRYGLTLNQLILRNTKGGNIKRLVSIYYCFIEVEGCGSK
jgi:hypothetical protein